MMDDWRVWASMSDLKLVLGGIWHFIKFIAAAASAGTVLVVVILVVSWAVNR